MLDVHTNAMNAFPWVLGADAADVENNLMPLYAPMHDGAIDHFRVSSVRR